MAEGKEGEHLLCPFPALSTVVQPHSSSTSRRRKEEEEEEAFGGAMPIAFGEVVETAVAVGLAAALGEAGVAAALALMGGGRRKFKSLYWRLRAEVRRQVAMGRERNRRFSFHYDPFSYALNFDDGCSAFLSL